MYCWLAGLPLTLNLLMERGLDHFRKPENRVVQAGGEVSTWELRHQLTHILLLLRLPFLFAGCLLGGGLWWVTRRLYGNRGGYTALALYCFSPAILKACVAPNAELLAALGVYGGVYTCIGVAHAMQGPRRKARPRMDRRAFQHDVHQDQIRAECSGTFQRLTAATCGPRDFVSHPGEHESQVLGNDQFILDYQYRWHFFVHIFTPHTGGL